MTRVIAVLLAASGLLSCTASAQLLSTGAGLVVPSAGPPPSCTNSLDFTQSCNSQYATVI